MFFLSLFMFLTLAWSARAGPIPILERRLAENIPWHLTDLYLFTAAPGPNGVSSVGFHFSDVNNGTSAPQGNHSRDFLTESQLANILSISGLELETYCSRTLPAGSGLSAVDPDNYYPCFNDGVSYRLGAGGKLDVKRTYQDDS